MEEELRYIEAILRGRVTDAKAVFGMKIAFENDEFLVDFYIGIPQTCAGLFFVGHGQTWERALDLAIKNVLENRPIKTELG